jgi:hypothetical protein
MIEVDRRYAMVLCRERIARGELLSPQQTKVVLAELDRLAQLDAERAKAQSAVADAEVCS